MAISFAGFTDGIKRTGLVLTLAFSVSASAAYNPDVKINDDPQDKVTHIVGDGSAAGGNVETLEHGVGTSPEQRALNLARAGNYEAALKFSTQAIANSPELQEELALEMASILANSPSADRFNPSFQALSAQVNDVLLSEVAPGQLTPEEEEDLQRKRSLALASPSGPTVV